MRRGMGGEGLSIVRPAAEFSQQQQQQSSSSSYGSTTFASGRYVEESSNGSGGGGHLYPAGGEDRNADGPSPSDDGRYGPAAAGSAASMTAARRAAARRASSIPPLKGEPLPPWLSRIDSVPPPTGLELERQVSRLRRDMSDGSNLSDEEVHEVVLAIERAAKALSSRRSSQGGGGGRGNAASLISGVIDFCSIVVETMELGRDALVAAAFHYCSCVSAIEAELNAAAEAGRRTDGEDDLGESPRRGRGGSVAAVAGMVNNPDPFPSHSSFARLGGGTRRRLPLPPRRIRRREIRRIGSAYSPGRGEAQGDGGRGVRRLDL